MKYLFSLLLVCTTFSIYAQISIKVGAPAPAINVTKWLANVPADSTVQDRFMVLEFWATWCKPCLEAVPHLNELQEKFEGRDLLFVSMTYESPALALPAIERTSFRTSVATDQTRSTQISFGDGNKQLPVYPFTVLIDDQNIVRWHGDPEDLTEEMLERLLARDYPVKNDLEKYVPLDPSDYLFEPMERKVWSQLFSADSVGSFVRVWPLDEIPTYTGIGLFIGTLAGGYFDDCSIEQLYQTLFPEKKVVVPDQLSTQTYTMAFVDRVPDADTKARIEAGLIEQLGLTAEVGMEANTHFVLKVKSKKQLSATKLSGRAMISTRDLSKVKIVRQTLRDVIIALTKHTDQNWSYQGTDRKKYSMTLDFTSTESILEGLARHGLKAKGKAGKIEVVRLRISKE